MDRLQAQASGRKSTDSYSSNWTSSPSLGPQQSGQELHPTIDRVNSAQSFTSIQSMNSDSSANAAFLASIPTLPAELSRRPTFAPPKPKPPKIITQMNGQGQVQYEPEPAYQRQPPPRTVSASFSLPATQNVAITPMVLKQSDSTNGTAVKAQRLEWKQTLDLYRANAKKTDNPKIQVGFAIEMSIFATLC